MCGIAGVAAEQAPALTKAMLEVMRYRGPDDEGLYRDSPKKFAMGMRRLSIIDLAGGAQPMANEDGTIWVICNGEIYNAPELREELSAKGHRFRTSHSDTECLLHLYEELGESLLERLNGMFAFVIYDQNRGRLFGARDRFGIKPLYISRAGGDLAFSSELKTLLLLPWVSREVDPQSLYHYLSLRYVPGEQSIFKDIRRLPPAHYFTYEIGSRRWRQERWWQPTFKPDYGPSPREWKHVILAELRQAVRRWAWSDVPLACSLSGGLDSTSVTALLKDSGFSEVSTYTLGFRGHGEGALDETGLAGEVARHWGTNHHQLVLTPDELLDDLPQMIWHLDEPYGGGLPSWQVFKFMSRDVKVGLTGTGGDELFGSYGKWAYYEHSLASKGAPWPQRSKEMARRLGARLPRFLTGPRGDYYRQWSRTYDHPFDAYPLYFDDRTKRKSVAAFPLGQIQDTADWLRELFQRSGLGDMRNGVAWVDMQTQLPEEFLLMTDRFSMAHSLEARVPFLDHIFVERMLSIPPEVRTRPDDFKYLLKSAVADLLPAGLLNAPKKGFVLPEALWLRGKLRPLARKLLSAERLKRQGMINPSVERKFLSPHLEARRDHSGQLWTLLMFQLWHLLFVEQKVATCPDISLKELI